MKPLRTLVAAAVVALAAGAGAAAVPGTIMLTEQDQGRTVPVTVGETLTVSLPENATTGYRWEIDRLDTNLLQAEGSSAHYPSSAVGSGGRVAFVFRAKAPGETQIGLKQWRPWEGERGVIGRFSVELRISP